MRRWSRGGALASEVRPPALSPLYAAGGAAGALYWMVIVVWIVSEALIGVRHAGGPADLRQDRSSGPALIGSVVLSVVLGSNLATQALWASIGAGREAFFVLGLLLAIGGVALRQVAVAALGRFFTTRVTTRADQTVVDTGPYRYVRHPSYSGMLVTVLGVLLWQLGVARLLRAGDSRNGVSDSGGRAGVGQRARRAVPRLHEPDRATCAVCRLTVA